MSYQPHQLIPPAYSAPPPAPKHDSSSFRMPLTSHGGHKKHAGTAQEGLASRGGSGTTSEAAYQAQTPAMLAYGFPYASPAYGYGYDYGYRHGHGHGHGHGHVYSHHAAESRHLSSGSAGNTSALSSHYAMFADTPTSFPDQNDAAAAAATTTTAYGYSQYYHHHQTPHYPYFAPQGLHYADHGASTNMAAPIPLHPPTPAASEPKGTKKECEPCGKVFDTANGYNNHIAGHVSCSFPDCGFSALKKIVREHEECEHGPNGGDGINAITAETGIKLPSLDTPEEIAQWIAERKKNWPSDNNVAKKRAEAAEGRAKGLLAPGGVKSKRKRGADDESTGAASGNNTTDNYNQEGNENVNKKQKRQCKYFLQGRCKHGAKCIYSHEKPTPSPPTATPKPAFSTLGKVKRRPLLRLLLEGEIKQEKNIILQCIRYIVSENFFEGEAVNSVDKEVMDVANVCEEEEDDVETMTTTTTITSAVSEEPTLASSFSEDQDEGVDKISEKVDEDKKDIANIILASSAPSGKEFQISNATRICGLVANYESTDDEDSTDR